MSKQSLRLLAFKIPKSTGILSSAGLMLFFWAIYDASISYLSPIIITEGGYSKTELGLIIGCSSIIGALCDFLLSKYIRKPHYRRTYILMFVICLIVPFILMQSKVLWLFLIAMGLWGLYFDLQNFSLFDLTSRISNAESRAHNSGILNIFRTLGYVIAPIVIGLLIAESMDYQSYVFLFVTIFLSIIFFITLRLQIKSSNLKQDDLTEVEDDSEENGELNFWYEIKLWKKIGVRILPVLIFSALINIFDAFFWTIGPILSESFSNFDSLNGLFLTADALPPLITGWFVGRIANKYGKKKTALVSFLIGALIMTSFCFISNPIFLLVAIFCASFFISFSLPALNSAYVDYISETRLREKEIEGLADFFTNIGYVIGPILAGVLADQFGNTQAFSIIGVIGALTVLMLLKFTPKHINI
jgi:MFS family permease